MRILQVPCAQPAGGPSLREVDVLKDEIAFVERARATLGRAADAALDGHTRTAFRTVSFGGGCFERERERERGRGVDDVGGLCALDQLEVGGALAIAHELGRLGAAVDGALGRYGVAARLATRAALLGEDPRRACVKKTPAKRGRFEGTCWGETPDRSFEASPLLARPGLERRARPPQQVASRSAARETADDWAQALEAAALRVAQERRL